MPSPELNAGFQLGKSEYQPINKGFLHYPKQWIKMMVISFAFPQVVSSSIYFMVKSCILILSINDRGPNRSLLLGLMLVTPGAQVLALAPKNVKSMSPSNHSFINFDPVPNGLLFWRVQPCNRKAPVKFPF